MRRRKYSFLLHLCQSSMPMGFAWAVYIAHTFSQSCINQAYSLFRSSRFNPGVVPLFLRENAPFRLTKSTPLALHIIDDISIIAENWDHEQLICLHVIRSNVLTTAILPIKESKSCCIAGVER